MPSSRSKRVASTWGTDLKDLARPLAVLLFSLGTGFLAWKFHLMDRLPELKSAIESFGPWGPSVFIVLNALAVVLALPAVLFSVAAGAIFGLYWGSLYAWLGGLVGAAAAFAAARGFAREAVGRFVQRHPLARKLEANTEKYDALLLVATRVLPVFPFVVVNYAWGMTRIRFAPYLFWSAIGKTPNFIFFVAVGAASAEGLSDAKISPDILWTLGIMAVVMAVVSIWVRNIMGPKAREPKKTDA